MALTEMQTRLLNNIKESLDYIQNYPVKSLRLECQKGIRTSQYSTGYLKEKSDVMTRSLEDINRWIELLSTIY